MYAIRSYYVFPVPLLKQNLGGGEGVDLAREFREGDLRRVEFPGGDVRESDPDGRGPGADRGGEYDREDVIVLLA